MRQFIFFIFIVFLVSLFQNRVAYAENNNKLIKNDEIVGLDNIENLILYENNVESKNNVNNLNHDYKKIYYTNDKQRLVNYADGYRIDLPRDCQYNFDYSPIGVKAFNEKMEILITIEWSYNSNVNDYIDHYYNRFITNEKYITANNITLLEQLNITNNTYKLKTLTIQVNDTSNENFNAYTYVTIQGNSQSFYRIMFKYYNDRDTKAIIDSIAHSFTMIQRFGQPVYSHINLAPVIPQNWSDETKKQYERICRSDILQWGIFTKDIYSVGINKTVPELEEKLDYKFDMILSYVHFNEEFPTDFIRNNYENGRMTELTYQITQSNNEDLFDFTPNLDVYRGKLDEKIRAVAQQAKMVEYPFLFRLNNEMNSDWASYSGIVNLCDPQVYVDNWRRIYNIFEEEGVNNAIWIFNPNDRNYPPAAWNDFLWYYPGNEYVHMIGFTGYNTGTYYKNVTGEQWREFDVIYKEAETTYTQFFSKFPWIITEFASSSIGGDKVKWIDNMFKHIKKCPNLKIAVWFSYADYDLRPEYKGATARPYWLDETTDTLEAFKRGLHN